MLKCKYKNNQYRIGLFVRNGKKGDIEYHGTEGPEDIGMKGKKGEQLL